MISEKMAEALNEQLKWEFWSGYLYLSMSAYFEDKGLTGFAQWMKNQAGEELFHATKMYDYINSAGGRVILQTVEAPQSDWESPLAVFEDGLRHEGEVTAKINNLMNLAHELKDHATANFLQWYIAEQVEEEGSFGEIVSKLKMVGDGGGMYMMDKELGARVFTWPAPAAQ
ncbi:MAG: ferritin [Desulfovibrio sp.]|uniref:ferritin n=1 Tax=Desulfovibrio sp. 7SRBS1 TaxID=3378064 RepID=UPI003B3DC9E1